MGSRVALRAAGDDGRLLTVMRNQVCNLCTDDCEQSERGQQRIDPREGDALLRSEKGPTSARARCMTWPTAPSNSVSSLLRYTHRNSCHESKCFHNSAGNEQDAYDDIESLQLAGLSILADVLERCDAEHNQVDERNEAGEEKDRAQAVWVYTLDCCDCARKRGSAVI